MPDRPHLVAPCWLVAALVALTGLMVALSRSAGREQATDRSAAVFPVDTPPPGLPTTCQGAPLAAAPVMLVPVLLAEGEEQDQADVPAEFRAAYQRPASLRTAPDRRPIAPGASPAPYPLRC